MARREQDRGLSPGVDGDAGPARRVLSVAELNRAIKAALEASFPRTIWVRGEVQRLPGDAARREHVYFELHEAGGGAEAGHQIPCALMRWDRQRYGLGRYLDGSDPDFRLADKLEVCLECFVDYYPPFGKLSLKVVGIDKAFTLGQLETRRRAVLAHLQREGLLQRQRALQLPALVRDVGLITAAGSAAEHDFLTGLAGSPGGFRVWRADCRMMGEAMLDQVPAALARLAAAGCQAIVIARGGGSRADLSWFDRQELAVAVALCPVPVITAIGHEIDIAIVDLVAHTRCKTPTAAAQLLADRARSAAAAVEAAAARLAAIAAALARAARELLRERARRLERAATVRLRRTSQGLEGQRTRLAAGAWRRSGAARAALAAAAPRLARLARGRCARAGQRLGLLGDKLRLLDPQRLLARGYTLTFGAGGRLLRTAAGLATGAGLATRFADGRVDSVVTAVAPDAPAAPPERRSP